MLLTGWKQMCCYCNMCCVESQKGIRSGFCVPLCAWHTCLLGHRPSYCSLIIYLSIYLLAGRGICAPQEYPRSIDFCLHSVCKPHKIKLPREVAKHCLDAPVRVCSRAYTHPYINMCGYVHAGMCVAPNEWLDLVTECYVKRFHRHCSCLAHAVASCAGWHRRRVPAKSSRTLWATTCRGKCRPDPYLAETGIYMPQIQQAQLLILKRVHHCSGSKGRSLCMVVRIFRCPPGRPPQTSGPSSARRPQHATRAASSIDCTTEHCQVSAHSIRRPLKNPARPEMVLVARAAEPQTICVSWSERQPPFLRPTESLASTAYTVFSAFSFFVQ